MHRPLLPLLVVIVLLLVATPARADDAHEAARRAVLAVTDAAAGVIADDRLRVDGALDAVDVALTDAASAAAGRRKAVRDITRTRARLDAARALVDDRTTSRRSLLRAIDRTGRKALRLVRRTGRSTPTCEVLPRPAVRPPIARKGRFRLRLRGADELEIADGAEHVVADPRARKRGRVRVDTDGAGPVLVRAAGCETPGLWLVSRPAWTDLDDALDEIAAPEGLSYQAPPLRVGEPFSLLPAIAGGGPVMEFTVTPPLPTGVSLDPATGAIGGTPQSETLGSEHAITARNDGGTTQAPVTLVVAPSLPDDVTFLEPGFTVSRVADVPAVPVKLAYLPDGRLLVNELSTGSVRLIGTDGTLAATPVVTLPILTGGERGLLGIAVAPDFATSGHVFVYASTPAGDGKPDRNRIVRLTLAGDVATDVTPIVDDLPIGIISNGGHLEIGPDGILWASIGDTSVETLAQTDGSRAGRILRVETDGSVPADNPIPDDPEWCRGLRNPFAFTFHAATGGVFISENGPTANDELNFGQAGKNFEWGGAPPDLPEFLRGFAITSWTPVIVPTGLVFGTEAFGAGAPDDLFLCSYDHAEIRRIALSGELRTDIDDESAFLRFARPEQIANKPLDIVVAPDGALVVSTFTAIWRVEPWAR